MPKSSLEVFFSPEGLIILPLAVVLDLVGIILVCFALDDFFITDIIGFATIGAWSFFRSQIKDKSAEKMPAFGEKKQVVKQLGKIQAQTQKAIEAAEQAQKAAEPAKDAKKAK